jgi:hypothetical protein
VDTDRLTTLARAKSTAAGPGRDRTTIDRQRSRRLCPSGRGRCPSTAAAQTAQASRAGRCSSLAACGKLAMSITMGYMLISYQPNPARALGLMPGG